MIGGVKGGSAITNKDHDKIKEVSKNIVKYLDMKEAGHYMYGMGYLFCQVIRCPIRIEIIKLITKKTFKYEKKLISRELLPMIILGHVGKQCPWLYMVY